MAQLKIGMRVITNTAVDIFPLRIWPAGTTGKVTTIEHLNGDAVLAHVTLDEHFDCLNEWDNALMVWGGIDEYKSEARLSSFDPLPP